MSSETVPVMGYAQVKSWLESHAHQTFYPKHPEFAMLTQVLSSHPNFSTWKYQIPEAFKITRTPKRKAIQVNVKFEGMPRKNKWRTVSWVACAKGKLPRKATKKNQLTQAMRFAVRVQIRNWRKRNSFNPSCELCECSKKDQLEVDHYPRPFATIRDQFLGKHESLFENVSLYWDNRKTSYRFQKNQKLNTSWQRYHAKHATYRWLCSDCNKKAR